MTGDRVPLAGARRPVLALGENAGPQSRIGGDWINRRIERFHGGKLDVIAGRALPEDAANRRWRNFDIFDLALNHAQ